MQVHCCVLGDSGLIRLTGGRGLFNLAEAMWVNDL